MQGTLSLFEWADPTGALEPVDVARAGRPGARAATATGEGALALPGTGRNRKRGGAAPRPATAAAIATAQPLMVGAPAADVSVPALSLASPDADQLRGIDDTGVLIFDVETTGTDRASDQVIELCIQIGLHDPVSRTWRFRPDVAISAGAQAVHGITQEALADCPPFAACIEEITAAFAQARVIAGYNVAFDTDMLSAEFARAGRAPLDLSDKLVVDAFRLWQQCEPRSLQHAHLRFAGGGFESAHSAAADVAATGRVLMGMMVAFGLADRDWPAIANVCDPTRATWIGPSRHFRWEQGAIVLGFGKHAGANLIELANGSEKGFLRWMLSKDFPEHVLSIVRAALERDAAEFLAWVEAQYGPSPSP